MIEEFSYALTAIVPSLIVAVITAIVSVRLAANRFYAERWWERKADVYSRIVELLYNAMRRCAARREEENYGRQMTDEERSQRELEYRDALQELRRVTSIGAFVISDDVADVLKELDSRPHLDPDEFPPAELYDHDYKGYAEALKEIKRLAKKDLKVK